MRDRLFESYLIKKHTDQSRLDIRDKLRDAVNSRSEIFNKSTDEKTQITKSYLEENTKNSSLLARGVSGN